MTPEQSDRVKLTARAAIAAVEMTNPRQPPQAQSVGYTTIINMALSAAAMDVLLMQDPTLVERYVEINKEAAKIFNEQFPQAEVTNTATLSKHIDKMKRDLLAQAAEVARPADYRPGVN